jgi:Ni,Fe-hydrogenase III small subunit
MFRKFMKKSPWLLHFNAGSCNGCDIEILSLLSPKYDVERFGVINRGNPKQADVLLVTGAVSSRVRERLIDIYSQMPEPKVVVAVGSCTCTGGVFRDMYHVENGVDTVIPVDVYIGGCAPRPEQMIDGIVQALDVLDKKNSELELPKRFFNIPKIIKHQLIRRDMRAKIGADDVQQD